MTMFSDGTIQGFKVDTAFDGTDDGSSVTIMITIRRSPITKAFSVIIIIGAFTPSIHFSISCNTDTRYTFQ
jgi:hypothetical protein